MCSVDSQLDPAAVISSRRRGRWHVRAVGLLVALPCGAVLAVAGGLRPDSRGYDTHTQLGLPACNLVQTTGMPCPTCGMTTAFAHMAHGHVVTAFRAQAFGVVLFLVAALALVLGMAQAVSNRNLLVKYLRPRAWWLWVGLGGVVAGWAIKMAIGLANGTLPVH